MATCSLIIPVFNHAAFLDACVQSALNQTEPFDEIIIVDDCSPDPRVASILGQFSKTPRVRIYRNESNLGIAITQNIAINNCTSEYIAFLDCDDILHLEARAGFNAYYELNQGEYFFSNRTEIDDHDAILRRVDVSSTFNNYSSISECLLEHMVASHFKVIKKSCLDNFGGFPEASAGVQDWVVAVNLIDDDNAVYMSEYLYFHRIHAGQTTGQDQVRFVNIVNSERERIIELRGMKSREQKDSVGKLAGYFSRVEELPEGAFILKQGLLIPWVRSWAETEIVTEPAILFYMPGVHLNVAQNFFFCKRKKIETVMIVDHKVPDSIALVRWANAFFDFIICLGPVARLAVEPWVADKTKLISAGEEVISRKLVADD